jgi:hypothetical protein
VKLPPCLEVRLQRKVSSIFETSLYFTSLEQEITMKKTIFMGLIIGAVATVIASSGIIPAAYATTIPKKDPGASGLSPGEDPHIPGWDPNGANDDVPGQVHCIGCTDENSPGQEGLKAGIIGPNLKK